MANVKTDRADMLNKIAGHVMDAITTATGNYPIILYSRETQESINGYPDYYKDLFNLVPDDEYFFIYGQSGILLYTVNVTADAPLTAAAELMDLIARKF